MKIAVAQIDCVVGDPEFNSSKMTAYARQAAERGCSVVVFPEMSDTGYLPSAINAAASRAAAFVVPSLQATALNCKIWIIAGLSEQVEKNLYNSVALISPAGEIKARYRKTHLFCPPPFEEHKIFAAGAELTSCLIEDSLWGVSICFDLRFPELFRCHALGGCKVLVNCTAWPSSRALHWETLTRARAIENQCYFLGVNRVGTDGELEFCGKSSIISPAGEMLAVGSSTGEELLIGDVDLKLVDAARAGIPVFDARRADIYGDWGQR